MSVMSLPAFIRSKALLLHIKPPHVKAMISDVAIVYIVIASIPLAAHTMPFVRGMIILAHEQ